MPKKICGFIILLFLWGCATAPRPVLYPNAYLQRVGPEQAQRDIAYCEYQAQQFVRNNPGLNVAKSTAVGAAGGAAVGAVGGAISGDPGKWAAIGAATGATGGLLRGMSRASQPSPLYKSYVEQCLRDKGYQPIGWQ